MPVGETVAMTPDPFRLKMNMNLGFRVRLSLKDDSVYRITIAQQTRVKNPMGDNLEDLSLGCQTMYY